MMSKDEFMREFAQCVSTEKKIDIPQEILDERPEFLYALYEAILGRLTVKELNYAYIVLVRLLLGKYPKVAAIVQSKDRIRLPYIALENMPATKGRLTSHERLVFAFCVFHSVCIEVYDENTGKIRKGITELTSPQKITELMTYDMEAHPERYEFLSPAKSSPEAHSSAPFGTSRDNPVKAVTIPDSYAYLESLRTREGLPVKYQRIGSMTGKDGGIIDGYTVTFMEDGTLKSMEIYIDPYAAENSSQAPEGLVLSDDDDYADDEDGELTELMEAAEDGDPQAQFKLGMMYYDGDGVAQDYSEAFRWYYKAAEQGYSGAQTNVGMMYSKGIGVTQDYRKALKWYRLAADKEFPEALHDLAFMYYTGEGVRQDIHEAINLWHRAALKGNANSQNNLGYVYRTGTGVTKNYTEALKWYRLSAEQDNSEALGDLGIMYENGQGVARDIQEAVKFYRLAAEKGNQEAEDALIRLRKV